MAVPTAPRSYTQVEYEPHQVTSFNTPFGSNSSPGPWEPASFITPVPRPVQQYAVLSSTSSSELLEGGFSTTMRSVHTPETTAVRSGFHSVDVGSFLATTEPFSHRQPTPLAGTSYATAGPSATSLAIRRPQVGMVPPPMSRSNGQVARRQIVNLSPPRSTSTRPASSASGREPYPIIHPSLASNQSVQLCGPGSATISLPAGQQLRPPTRTSAPPTNPGSSATSLATQQSQTAMVPPPTSPPRAAQPSYAQVTRGPIPSPLRSHRS
jgi:hypothetical protein